MGGVGEVKKQSKKIIQSLQMCPKMASLRQRNMLISLIYLLSQVKAIKYIYNNKKGFKPQKQSSVNLKLTLPSYTHIYFKK